MFTPPTVIHLLLLLALLLLKLILARITSKLSQINPQWAILRLNLASIPSHFTLICDKLIWIWTLSCNLRWLMLFSRLSASSTRDWQRTFELFWTVWFRLLVAWWCRVKPVTRFDLWFTSWELIDSSSVFTPVVLMGTKSTALIQLLCACCSKLDPRPVHT